MPEPIIPQGQIKALEVGMKKIKKSNVSDEDVHLFLMSDDPVLDSY